MPAAIKKFDHAWLSLSSLKNSHKCGTIVVRQTSNRSPHKPPFHFTSPRSGIYIFAFGDFDVSTRLRSPACAMRFVETKTALAAQSWKKRFEDFIGLF